MRSLPRRSLLDSILIFAIAAWIMAPWFGADYIDNWASIESTFIGDGRMLAENWPGSQWQPHWYLGTRFDYVYPPMLRYGTAGLSRLLGVPTARGYHLYTGILYCLGIVGVYWLVRIGSGRRVWAIIAALGCAIYSPTYLFLKHFREGYEPVRYMALRLGVLVRYGEGPHMSALAMLSFALAASWWGARRRHPAAMALAGIFSALVVSNNFYGATALALLFPVLVWALWITERDIAVLVRSAAISLLAYGLTAFWLTPSYVRVTLENMRLVSKPGNAWSLWVEIGVLLAFGLLSWKLAAGRPERAWPVFVAGCFIRLTLQVLGHYYYDFRVIGEPERLGPEFDQAFVIASVAVLAWLWDHRGKLLVIGLIWLSLLPVKGWVRRSWQYIPVAAGHEQRIEFKLTRWLHENLRDSRLFATGSVRFWYNAWFTLSEAGGGSDQGTLNPNAAWAYSQVTGGDGQQLAVAWLQATGTDAVLVHDQTSHEIYHDYAYPKKFEGLPVLYHGTQGDWVYKVPRKYPGLARIVTAAHRKLAPPNVDYDYDRLRPYAESVEALSPRPAEWKREGNDAMRVRATLQPGELLVVQETFDPYWRAYASDGRRVPIEKDALSFLLLDPGPGSHDIRLRFETPLENWVGRGFTMLSVLVCAALFARARKGIAA